MAQLTGSSRRLPTIGAYLSLLRQHWAIITAATLLGLAVGGVAQSLQPAAYSASAAVELPPIASFVSLDPRNGKPPVATIDTTAQLVMSDPVVQRVREATGQSADEVRAGLTVSAYPLSSVLIVAYVAPTPEAAATGARAATLATLDQRSKVLGGAQLLKARTLYARLARLRSRAAEAVPQFPRVTGRLDEQARHLALILNQLPPPGRFIVEPSRDPRPVASHPELHLTTGATSGLVAGIVIAYWRASGNRKLERR